MSRFTRYATTSQTLSLTAMEEASRRGLRQAGLQDLLLALVLNDQPAGEALRHLGITITTARAAVQDHQQEQIASLGIAAEVPEPGNIVFHETGGYEWSPPARDLLGRAWGRGRTADAAAVLRELLAEPSGLITELLHRLGTTPGAVLAQLARAESSPMPPQEPGARRRGEVTGATGSFAPAPVEDVWALVSDPARIPEWEPAIGAVESARGPVRAGMTWMAHARTTHPDGKPLKVNNKFRRRGIELVEAHHLARVVWRFTHPDAPTGRPMIIAVDLTPTTGGTQLALTLSWSKHHGWRSPVSTLLRPLQQFLLWIKLSQISSSISRAFR
jgi:uncharacterized protein YndB with AHSA1/START domain